jgi:hypothetical protein
MSSSPEALVCAALRHEPAPWPYGDDPAAIRRVLDTAAYHGVVPLLDAEFAARNDLAGWPTAIVVACHKSTLARAMQELAQRAELIRVLRALAAIDIVALVLKGGALAYSHYPDPSLRPRADTDLLIPRARRDDAADALARLGYTKSGGVEGEYVSYQATWSREAGSGVVHHLDVHWRVNNSQMLAKVFDYDELARRAVPLPALGSDARALCAVDALLFACMHRAGHVNAPYHTGDTEHANSDRLVWLYDVHLLVMAMSDAELDEFTALARAKGIRAICLDALQRSAECFATPIALRVTEALAAPGAIEPSACLLGGGKLHQMVGDLRALDGWTERARWLAETAFPSAAYMRSKYPDAGRTWLPILYARRGASGVARLLAPHRAGGGH